MNRRILLIDADPAFHETLAGQLGRYGISVVVEANPDQALALASADLPALLIVGVEEPEKSGFKVFQKSRKGALGKVPIMLVTASVPPDSFAKHKGLKTHADEYLDKRKYAVEDLVKKIDGLITLGPPIEDDLDIPVEIDDIPLADGDMVLEEEVGIEEIADFGEDPHAHGDASQRVDAGVDADIENAFGDMLGDDFGAEPGPSLAHEPAIVAAPAEPERREEDEVSVVEGIPQRIGSRTQPPPFAEFAATRALAPHASVLVPVPAEVPAEVHDEEAVPGMILDGGLSDNSGSFDTFSQESIRPPSGAHGLLADDHAEPVLQKGGGEIRIPASLESSPAIALDPDDLQVVEEEIAIDEVAVAGADDPGADHSGADELLAVDVGAVDVSADDVGTALEYAVEEVAVDAAPSELDPEPDPALTYPEPEPEPVPPRAKFIDAPTNVEAPPIEHAPAPAITQPAPGTGARGTSGLLNIPDLGLDQLAQDADREQSGAYDRRALRQIGELERQIAQMKVELDRTRTSAESASRPTSREGEFLKLRENLLNAGKDLTRAKEDLAARDRELADLGEKLRQAQQARTAVEGKVADLEQRTSAEGSKAAAIEARERGLAAQLATTQQELVSKTQLATEAETARAQLERDLANERAMRASSASEAERALRVEREQMIARHQGELASVRGEAASALETTVAPLRAEVEALQTAAAAAKVTAAAEHAAALAKQKLELEAAHQAAVEGARIANERALASSKDAAAQELATARTAHEQALAAAHEAHQAAAAAAEEAHAQTVAAAAEAARHEIATEADQAVSQLEERQAADLKRLADELADKHATEHAAAIASVEAARDAVLKRAHQDAEAALAGQATEHAAALTELAAAHAGAIESHTANHATALTTRNAEHAAMLAMVHDEHAAELARLKSEAGGAVAVAAADQARTQAAHEHALAQATAALAREADAHAGALAKRDAEHGAALAKRDAEHAAAREQEAASQQAQLAELKAELERQTAAHGTKLDVAKREVEQLLAQHEATKQQHEVAKQQLVDEQRRAAEAVAAQHAQALAKAAEDSARAIADIEKAAAEHRAASDAAGAQHREALASHKEAADRENAELRAALAEAKHVMQETAAKAAAEREEAAVKARTEREAAEAAHAQAMAELKATSERALAVAHGETVKAKAVADAEHGRAMAAKDAEHKVALGAREGELAKAHAELTAERDEIRKGLSSSRDAHKRTESELASAVQTLADRNAELRSHATAVAERDQRIADLRKEIEGLETENASYQEQVLRAYQKIKTDEAMVARAKKAMAIALTVLDDQGQPKES